MTTIGLEGMCFYAHHGYYQEEQQIGNEYLIDLHVRVNLQKLDDKLENTVNYENLYEICKAEMKIPKALLETICSSIMNKIQDRFSEIQHIKIVLRKKNPPMNGEIKFAMVEMEKSFI